MATNTIAMFVALVVTPLAPLAGASSVYLAGLCRGGQCNDPRFPISDYDPAKGTCICMSHPCWRDKKASHTCDAPEFPFLHFTYSDDRELQCSCSSFPRYDSRHIARDLCAGHMCETAEFPILDWDADQQKCFCRAQPCPHEGGSGHQCGGTPQFPIPHYREEMGTLGAQPKCECKAKFHKPIKAKALRGMCDFEQTNTH
mmetsp:Transcript_123372/g.308193  ORF Transcript_123372/g.308193 Transcript_123372/m.308193 type:complete len:200 (+) Transcript_123372:64-663(+)